MTPSLYEQQTRLVMQLLPLVAAEPAFALKGGTAINYFFREMPRYSIDIDLCYLPLQPRPESLQEISNALCRIERAIYSRMADAECKKHMLPQSNTVFKLTVKRRTATVKIEPNIVLRGCAYPAVETSLTRVASDHFRVSLSMATLSFPDLYGGKICAALDRQHPRDLFDIMLLFENEGITDEIRQAFVVYLVSHSRPMAELLRPNLLDIEPLFTQEFEGMTRRKVRLHELTGARERLIRTIHSDLTDAERAFIISVKERRPAWDMLPVNGVEHLPGLQWKLLNLERMDPAKYTSAVERLKRCLEAGDRGR